RPVALPLALDPSNATFQAFGIRGLPTTVIVDREGRIASRSRPEQVTREVLQRVLKGEPAGLPLTTDVPVDVGWQPELNEEGEVFASVVLGPSSAYGSGSRSKPGSGRLSGDGEYLINLIQLAWDVPNTRVVSSLAPWSPEEPKYKVSVFAPGGDD